MIYQQQITVSAERILFINIHLEIHIHESIILQGYPVFLNIDKNKLDCPEKIEETTRLLIPPAIEEYPYIPYDFENIEEIDDFVNMIKRWTGFY